MHKWLDDSTVMELEGVDQEIVDSIRWEYREAFTSFGKSNMQVPDLREVCESLLDVHWSDRLA